MTQKAPNSADVARALEVAARVYRGDQDMIVRFMETPHPKLSGRTPLEASEEAAGADRVIDLLRSAESGFPV
ncbi:MbcA/ParS/Xre antitoxin family protein [Tranquillimonas alkanivorans]|uniref:Antitoxin Xre/MbcA/ParS-like toxin-binding domain-containing protein n=1 Tax=Tranquillimonas alkanivorans TaxID=441119 RepID=A0A1I5V1D4_9RHOB|nr:MbcA/ParS/Xre antitoxin family protein [Tranquillimonas alkanivorans]SFQ01289.1 Protein of unknown function [Tranquillimonas alkanivorans]